MKVRWTGRISDQELRERRHIAKYLREFRPGGDTPEEPCPCGDTTFYRLKEVWRCRSTIIANKAI